ncbi:MAG: SpoIIE family protein phosphatase [Tepidisphaeraceae bacterium]
MLSVGMRYKGRPIGVLKVYTATERHFEQYELDLLKAIAAQASAAIENTRLLEEKLASEAVERQVRMAADVQQRMLPSGPPNLPGIDVAYTYIPCFDLAGDFFDFIELPDQNFGIVIADVSGKGVPASLIMASVRGGAAGAGRQRLLPLRSCPPAERDALPRHEADGIRHALLRCATTSATSGSPTATPATRRRCCSASATSANCPADNTVLGIDPDMPYTQNVIDLQTGDAILLYTDGLPDAMNFDNQTYGTARVHEAYKNSGGGKAQAVVDHLLWDVRRFAGMAPRNDDLTMIVMKID